MKKVIKHRNEPLNKVSFLVLLTLIGSALACATPAPLPTLIPTFAPIHTIAPPPTVPSTPLPTNTPVPTLLPTEVTSIFLDECSLLTPEEVEATLGSPVTAQPALGTGCSYTAEPGEDDMPVSITLSACHGEEGKLLQVTGISMIILFTGGSEAAEEELERLKSNLPDMTMQEMIVTEINPILESIGFEITPYDGIGDSAFWLWFEDEHTTIGELLVVQGESCLTVAVINQPEDAALVTAEPLVKVALDRLPPVFSVLSSD